MHIRQNLPELQSRGKEAACPDEHSKKINFPQNRRGDPLCCGGMKSGCGNVVLADGFFPDIIKPE